jgi:hypothetical protein
MKHKDMQTAVNDLKQIGMSKAEKHLIQDRIFGASSTRSTTTLPEPAPADPNVPLISRNDLPLLV